MTAARTLLAMALALAAPAASAQAPASPPPSSNSRPLLDRFNADWAGDTSKTFEIAANGSLLRGSVSVVTSDFVQLSRMPDKEQGVTATIPWSAIRYWIVYPPAPAPK